MTKEERAKEIISKVSYITLATASKDAQPWNTPLLVAFDDRHNAYWTSFIDTQHSCNIRENPRVYISIYEPAVSGLDGVYMQAQAEELEDPTEVQNAIQFVYPKKGKDSRPTEEFIGEASRRMYKASPEKFWISLDRDAKIDPRNAKTEITLL